MESIDLRREWDLPSIKEVLTLPELVGYPNDLEDVKFFPYSKPGADPIFAANNITHVNIAYLTGIRAAADEIHKIIICRIASNKGKLVEIISVIRDEDPDAKNHSIAWSITQDGIPLICVSGENAKIKIVNALTGELRMTLTGHGGDINDLAVSPVDPSMLVSGSEDTSLRLWDLNAEEGKRCVVIFAGEGHRDKVLSVAFHENGQYLISGGQDRMINLWTIPSIQMEHDRGHKPVLVHYPHFSTVDIHETMVDCVAFHHDLIISKDDDGKCIVLWKIIGFSSSNPSTKPLRAPALLQSTQSTRSAFHPHSSLDDTSPQYIRLLQFFIKDCSEFYIRFSLFTPPLTSTRHPILAICNSTSKVFFWDLARLDAYHDFISSLPSSQRPHWLRSKAVPKKDPLNRVRESSPNPSIASSQHTTPNDSSAIALSPAELQLNKPDWDRKYAMGRSTRVVEEALEQSKTGRAMTVEQATQHMLVAHKAPETIKDIIMTGRQIAWSPSGEYCVVGGSPNVIAVLQRWGDIKVKGKGKEA